MNTSCQSPLSMKACRAPIPLDFKHPVSPNTVPGEEPRTRRAVRSNFSSREIFEYPSRPSLDDLHVPTISHKASRAASA
ncbi:hypothetical protein EDB85DRAFT_2040866, partial [Lactarius pseudohatsudake]